MSATTESAIDFKRFGYLAYVFCERQAELQILKTCAYYIGTVDEDGMPCSRESVEYFDRKDDAEAALASGDWTQKRNP